MKDEIRIIPPIKKQTDMKGTQQYKEAKRMEREGISKRNEIGKSSTIEWNQQGRGD